MTFKDFDEKLKTNHKPNPHIPTQDEITEAQVWVVENFPYSIAPSRNPGQGTAIQAWLDSNIGPMDENWTWMYKEIRFRTKEDYILYGLTWQKFDEA
jgi:hypothetical protein